MMKSYKSYGKSGTMREVRDNAVCHPERGHHGKGLCSVCSQRYWKAMRAGERPSDVLQAIVSGSDARETERRRLADEVRKVREATRLTQERVRELFDYSPDDGLLRWRVSQTNNIEPGDIAGYRNERYFVVEFDGSSNGVHRIIWLWMTGEWPDELDHRDLDSFNNKWRNLRKATRSQNAHNVGLKSVNTSGYKGVSWHAVARKWRAHLTVEGVRYDLGLHAVKEDAAAAYRDAAVRLVGEFARVA